MGQTMSNLFTIPRTSKACKNIDPSDLCDIFWKRHSFRLRALFHFKMLELILQKLTVYMSLIVPTDLLSSRECYLISFAPFCVAWYCQYLVLTGWVSGMIVDERSSIILMKQMSHEINVILKNMKKIENTVIPSENALFPSKRLYFEGHKPLPWENQSNLCTGNGSLDKPHSNSLALSNRRTILNSESATKCCQINCVAVSMFYILFL
jgi:hypothetical protein